MREGTLDCNEASKDFRYLNRLLDSGSSGPDHACQEKAATNPCLGRYRRGGKRRLPSRSGEVEYGDMHLACIYVPMMRLN